MPALPIPRSAVEGKVKCASSAPDGFGVGIELRGIAILFSIKKGFDVATGMFAKLVIRDPLRSLSILDIAIDAEGALSIT